MFWTDKKVSPRFTLNKSDVEKWVKNGLVFAGPALLVLLASVVDAIPKDWKYGAVALYVVNVVTDLLRKFLDKNK